MNFKTLSFIFKTNPKVETDENNERSKAGGSERVEGLKENNELAVDSDLLQSKTSGGEIEMNLLILKTIAKMMTGKMWLRRISFLLLLPDLNLKQNDVETQKTLIVTNLLLMSRTYSLKIEASVNFPHFWCLVLEIFPLQTHTQIHT